MNIILIGPPGVGKGTYGDRIKEKYHLLKIATGDMFRAAVAEGTELGKIAQGYMSRGEFVPDGITIGIVRERIAQPDARKGVMFDGFPRTVAQADALNQLVDIDAVLNFDASDDVIIGRASGRRVCPNCQAIFHIRNIPPKQEGICDHCRHKLILRDDDKEATVRQRLKTFRQQTQPLIDYYGKKGVLHTIDASRPTEKIPLIMEDCFSVLDSMR